MLMGKENSVSNKLKFLFALQFGVVLFEICTGLHPARWRQDFTGEYFHLYPFFQS